MSIVLLLAALYGVMRAAMLCFAPVNRSANRMLASLVVVLALYIFPYIVGYAGYYDAYPWLSFFPYNLTLAIGPLLYLYVVCAHAGGSVIPARWALHFVPALAQLLYYSVLFAQPLDVKNSWDAAVHLPYVSPAETALTLGSFGVYLALAFGLHQRAAASPQAPWMRDFLVAMALTLAAWVALTAAELLFSGLNYFQRFPFYVWLAVALAYLATEGYRHGSRAWPVPADAMPAPVPLSAIPPAQPPAPPPAPTQAELGERWRAMVIEGRWWRDPELSLASLAQKIGTNTTALSRAMNEGLGLNFNEMINRLRVDAVVAALQQADENQAILDIALSEGFNSKASFNRAFKLYTGKTPSEYRRPRACQAQVSDQVSDPS